MNTVQPMEIDNNYYSYRDKKREGDVYPILYLDNGLTIYSDKENRIIYDNKENTNLISETKIDNFAKKYSQERTNKTEAEKQINNLEHILIDFEKNKGHPKVTVMVNPDVSIPPSTTRAPTTRTSTTTIDPSECIDISAEELKQKMLETVEGTGLYERFDTVLKEISKGIDGSKQNISLDCEFIDNFAKDKMGFNVDMCSKDPSIINELSPKLGFKFRNVCKKTCNNKCSNEIIHGIKEPPECTNVSAEDMYTLLLANATEEEKRKEQNSDSRDAARCDRFVNGSVAIKESLCEKGMVSYSLNKQVGFNVRKMCKKTCNKKCPETHLTSSRQPIPSSRQPIPSSRQPIPSSTTRLINRENRLNNNELNNLIDIGNSNSGCPESKTPKCFLGFSLKYNNNHCPYTVCYEKIALNILLDIGLLAIAIAIVYFLYRLLKK